MKKLTAVLLTGIVAVGVLAGCGNSTEREADSETIQTTEQTTENNNSQETEAEEQEAVNDEEVTVLKFGSFQTTIQPILADELGYFEEQLAPYNVKLK